MPRIEPFDEDLDILQKLQDIPNLTAKEMQKEFDKSGNIIKAFLNNIVIPVINGIVAVTGQTDKTLTVEDAPADAKATGAAMSALRESITNALSRKLDLSGGVLSGALSMSSNRITSVGNPIADTDAVNKQYTDGIRKFFYNVSVPASAFASSTTYADFGYRAAISLNGCLATMIPEVVFPVQDAVQFAPVAESYNGGIYIYADDIPANGIVIPTIILWRGDSV